MSKDIKVGDLVMLIGTDECMPPIGYIGEVTGALDSYGDHSVLFKNYLWKEVMKSNNFLEDDCWEIPEKWLIKINPPALPEEITKDEEITV